MTRRRSSAMWAGGPPKPVIPIRVHSRAVVPRGTRRKETSDTLGLRGDAFQELALEPVHDPVVETLGVQLLVEPECGFVPVKCRPLEAGAAPGNCNRRDRGDQRLANARATVLGRDVQV